MDGLRAVELERLLGLWPAAHDVLAPGPGVVVSGRRGAMLTLLSGRVELWEVISVATSFASQADADPAAILTSLGKLNEQEWPESMGDAAGRMVERDYGLAEIGFPQWLTAQPTVLIRTPTVGILRAARVIDLAFPVAAVRSAAIGLANVEVCIEMCSGDPDPTACLLSCLEAS